MAVVGLMHVPLEKKYLLMAPGWVTTIPVPVPLPLNAVWIEAIACWVAISARPAAAFWREKFFAAICSTREVERKETVMVASSAVTRRTSTSALPQTDCVARRLGWLMRAG